jgi:hypothetical protein
MEGVKKEGYTGFANAEACIEASDIVVDCTTTTCDSLLLSSMILHFRLFIMQFLWLNCHVILTSIHACRKAGRHIVAMEEDEEIFKALL